MQTPSQPPQSSIGISDFVEDDILDIVDDVLSSGSENELPKHKVSYLGKKPNLERNREHRAKLLFQDYFSESPTYDGSMFQRRFRITKQRFIEMFYIPQPDTFFTQQKDFTGKMGLSGLHKATAALRVLAYRGLLMHLTNTCE